MIAVFGVRVPEEIAATVESFDDSPRIDRRIRKTLTLRVLGRHFLQDALEIDSYETGSVNLLTVPTQGTISFEDAFSFADLLRSEYPALGWGFFFFFDSGLWNRTGGDEMREDYVGSLSIKGPHLYRTDGQVICAKMDGEKEDDGNRSGELRRDAGNYHATCEHAH